MHKFPKRLIIRYYELAWIDVTYSDNWNKDYKNKIWEKLQNELEENKHLESFEIFYNGENIMREEER
jgi:hypothetical protein